MTYAWRLSERLKAYVEFGPGALGGFLVPLVLSVDNMNAKVSGRESLNGAAEPGRDLLEIDVFDSTKSVRAKNPCNASRLETAARMLTNSLKLFGPLRFQLQLF